VLPNWKGKRYIYGFSNGGAFCMHAGINHPDLFEEIIAFSTADYITEFLRPIEFHFEKYPKFYMGAGRYEESIFKENTKFVPKLKSKNIQVEFKEFISGHDYNVWKFEFLTYLKKRFGK
jgi:enterochelin esterase-like enzyme